MTRLRAQGSGLKGLKAQGSRLKLILVSAWLFGAVVTWNMVFDAHIVTGARDYVDAQQLFVEGRGPRQDMGRAMSDARAAGLRAASLWTGVELAPGLVIAGAFWFRTRRAPAAMTSASR